MLRGFRLHRCPSWIRPAITISDHNGMFCISLQAVVFILSPYVLRIGDTTNISVSGVYSCCLWMLFMTCLAHQNLVCCQYIPLLSKDMFVIFIHENWWPIWLILICSNLAIPKVIKTGVVFSRTCMPMLHAFFSVIFSKCISQFGEFF